MAYCRNCGAHIDDEAVMCPQCGAMQTDITKNKSNSLVWGILGGLVPLVGLILFLTWKNTRPQDSKAAGLGALIGVAVWLLL